jgi:transcriptional regulator with XRE-family HTH domain
MKKTVAQIAAEHDWYCRLGWTVRKARYEAGLTLRQLAGAMHCYDPDKLSRCERGHAHFSLVHLVRAAEALGCRPASLFPSL